MKIYIQDAEQCLFGLDGLRLENTAVALGTFDALHIGHTAIIRRAVQEAEAHGRTSVVYLFLNLPANVTGKQQTEQLYGFEEKCRILETLGVDVVLAERFTADYMKKTDSEFFTEYLVNKLDARFLSVGFNYHFGKDGAGDVERLADLCRQKGITLHVQPCIRLDEVVSSTCIRRLLQEGAVDRAAAYLGRYFTLSGEVIHGNGQGRIFGFPTANMALPAGMIPRFGVYITAAQADGVWHPSVTNIGEKPTVKRNKTCVETHLLDYTGDLYGKRITVRFIQFMRGITKFEGIEGLIAQVEQDKVRARVYFRTETGGADGLPLLS